MNKFDTQLTVGEIVIQNPNIASVFEAMEIDYCCGGKNTLVDACSQKGLDPRAVLVRLREGDRLLTQDSPPINVTTMSLTELVNHIEKTHHSYLLEELPRLAGMIRDVVSKHCEKDPRLKEVQQTYIAMAVELWGHMLKEEQCLFPMIRDLETSNQALPLHCGTIANPIRQMESEHDNAGSALEGLRELTDGFSPPAWACKTYRALLAALAYFERDMHTHVHKENNVLFPRALDLEAIRKRGLPVA